ncbi:transposase [Streptomyces sp. NPDC058256]|uniref:transposase n=1 Tax=Streptomyces sp. NPDC058256 TaxID=3346408 RepID=UPI0036DFAAF5
MNQFFDHESHPAGAFHVLLRTVDIAKENLRTLLTVARTGADRHQVGHARWKFLTWCADSDIPEVRTLAATVDRWWPEIAAFIETGYSNAKSEGINRVINHTSKPRDQMPHDFQIRSGREHHQPRRKQPSALLGPAARCH